MVRFKMKKSRLFFSKRKKPTDTIGRLLKLQSGFGDQRKFYSRGI